MENKNIVEFDGKRYMKVKKGAYYDKKRKRKIHHPIRTLLITCLTVFIVAPVAFVFGAFYEPGTKADLPTATNYLDLFQTKLATGLLEIPNGSFTAGLDEGSIDGLLGYTRKMLEGSAANNFIGNFYCYINGNKYEFVGDAQASFFKTKIHIYTTLENNDEQLRFKINDISLGRLPVANIASYVLPKFLSEDNLNQMISKAGMRAKFSIANREITYKKTEFREDMGNIMGSLLGESGATIGSLIFNLWDDLDESGISFDNGITVKVNISKLMHKDEGVEPNENHCTTENRYKLYVKFVEQLINSNIIKSDNGTTMLKYLVKGYDSNNQTIVSLFNNSPALQTKTNEFLKSSELGIYPIELYNQYRGDNDSKTNSKGYRNNHQEDITEALYGTSIEKYKDSKIIIPSDISKISQFLVATGNVLDGLHLKDNLISDYIRSTDLVGPLFAMPIVYDNKTYYSSLSLSDFSMDFQRILGEDYLVVDADLDFYGAGMPLRMYTKIKTDGVRSMKFELQSDMITLGNVTLNANAVNSLLGFLKDSITGAGPFSFEVDTKTGKASFVFNIANLATQPGESATDQEKIIYNILSNQPGEYTFNVGGIPFKYKPNNIGIKLELDDTDNHILKLNFVNNGEPEI